MDLGIAGKRALITGGSHGIGLATAQALAAEGCHIAICSRTADRLAAAAETLSCHGTEVMTMRCDVLAEHDIEQTLAHITARWGGVDILVNNVGGGGRWGQPSVEETEERVWVEVFTKNALAAIRFTVALLPEMRRRQWGRVVTITSRLGREGGGRPWFNVAKAAQTSLMKTLGMMPDLARDGITFNSVAPGSIMIPDTGWAAERDRNPDGFQARLDAEFPLARLGTPEEVAAVVAFVCSARASLLNGAAVAVDGGESRAF